MKRKTTLSAIGGYQPFLFCAGMYFVALFFSIFICSAIFHAANPKSLWQKRKLPLKDPAGVRYCLPLPISNNQ